MQSYAVGALTNCSGTSARDRLYRQVGGSGASPRPHGAVWGGHSVVEQISAVRYWVIRYNSRNES